MIKIIYDIIWIMESFLTPLCMFIFLSAMFFLRSSNRKVNGAKLFTIMACEWYLNSFHNPTWNLCGGFILLSIGAVWMFRVSIRYVVLYMIYLIIVVANIEMFFSYLNSLLGLTGEASWLSILIAAIEIISKLCLTGVIRRQVRSLDTERNHNYMGFLSLFSAAIFIFLISGVYPSAGSHRENFFMVLSSMLFVFANVVGFSVAEKMMETARNHQEDRLMVQKAELERLHYKSMEDMTTEYRAYVHELEQSLRTLRQLWKNSEDETADQLEASVKQLRQCCRRKLYHTDPIVNAILTEKEKVCREQQLKYEVSIAAGISFDFIEDIDKISIFSNVMDNAVEAAAQTEHGFVRVSLHMGNKALFMLKVENSCSPDIREIHGHYLTTKPDKKNHGFGIRKMKQIVSKYNGFLDLHQESGVFSASMILSTVQKTVS